VLFEMTVEVVQYSHNNQSHDDGRDGGAGRGVYRDVDVARR